MIRLHASYGLKVPAEQDYSSQSYHATAEIELADATAQDPEAMRRALHGLWFELKKAVAEEIGGGQTTTDGNGRTAKRPRANVPASKNGTNGNGQPATKKQIGFLLSLFRRHRDMSAEEARAWLRDTHGLSLNDLSKSQAGNLIDELQQAAA